MSCLCFSGVVGIWLIQLLFGEGSKLLKIETQQIKITESAASENPAQIILNNIESVGPIFVSQKVL